MKQPADALIDQICDAMVATIFAFPPPPEVIQPAEKRPDDRERVMDRIVFYDEKHMQTLISSLDDNGRIFLKAVADRERLRLPLFPAYFKICYPVIESLHGSPESLRLEEKVAL